MYRLFAPLTVVAGLLFAVFFFWPYATDTTACLSVNDQVALCAASDMAKLPNHGPVAIEHPAFAIAEGPVRLEAARNETIAFQLLIQRLKEGAVSSVSIKLTNPTTETGIEIPANSIRQYQAWYHYVDRGGYTWGPQSEVLPWPDYYPDALIPETPLCTGDKQSFYNSVPVPDDKGGLQSVWLDFYIPREQEPGLYQSTIVTSLSTGDVLEIPLEITVWPATLPDRPSIDAVGEVYIAYHLEGGGMDMSTEPWKQLAHCYQKLAHQHRVVFIERTPKLYDGSDWAAYDAVYGPILDGSLFSEENGYFGPGVDTPVTVWRTPWPQQYDVELQAPLPESDLQKYTSLAQGWVAHAREMQWDQSDFFAYVFDEVDGPLDSGNDTVERREYLAMVHDQMKRLQAALDAGSGGEVIDLLWTSHSDPSIWLGDEALDLVGKVRWWAPNAVAANPSFFADRQQEGEKIWFYHAGHPHIGIHSINASGIEMRTWGVIGARYDFDGQLMWAVNLGSDTEPFARPSYRDEDDRFGNGVLVYPGNQLPKIGFRSEPGPIPSMRLKAWRRGLQDAELIRLAKAAGNAAEAEQLLRRMIPAALGEADGEAEWPEEAGEWIEFRRKLLRLASENRLQ